MTKLRIAMVKILKSNLGIVKTSRYFHCRQKFREIIMANSIKIITTKYSLQLDNAMDTILQNLTSLTF
jgi:hypothetical protein